MTRGLSEYLNESSEEGWNMHICTVQSSNVIYIVLWHFLIYVEVHHIANSCSLANIAEKGEILAYRDENIGNNSPYME